MALLTRLRAASSSASSSFSCGMMYERQSTRVAIGGKGGGDGGGGGGLDGGRIENQPGCWLGKCLFCDGRRPQGPGARFLPTAQTTRLGLQRVLSVARNTTQARRRKRRTASKVHRSHFLDGALRENMAKRDAPAAPDAAPPSKSVAGERGASVVDLRAFLSDPSSVAAKEACDMLASSFERTGIVLLKDPRVSTENQTTFLDMMEDYFAQPTEAKMPDVRAELHYQVRTHACLCHAHLLL